MMRFLLRLFWLLAVLPLAGAATAATPAGSAVEVIQQAEGSLEGTTTNISAGDGMFMGQQIVTGNEGQVQIVFNDDTHLVVGPGSTLVISEYLMRNDNTASKFVVDALAGTFRFATGNSNHDAYEINTPTGTLGVRGTWFDFSIDPVTHETLILLYDGAVDMCGIQGRCVRLSEICGLGVIPQQSSADIVGFKLKPTKLKGFPYLMSQRPLRSDFRFRGGDECKPPVETAAKEKPAVQEDPVTPPPDPDPDPGPDPEPDPPCHNHDQHHGSGCSPGDNDDDRPRDFAFGTFDDRFGGGR